jgi:hypothetical protein
MGIYGAGRSTALRWAVQGLRTLQDVLEKGNVTENQRIGIELYEVCPLTARLTLGFLKANPER